MPSRSKQPDEHSSRTVPSRPSRTRGSHDRGASDLVRSLDDDIFDMAHNSMLRKSMPTNAHLKIAESPEQKLLPPPRELRLDDDIDQGKLVARSDTDQLRVAEIQDAVDATWAKANAMQKQAVEVAARTAAQEERQRLLEEHSRVLAQFEEKARYEIEKAKRQTWESSSKEKEKAIAEALEAQAEALLAAQKEAVEIRERTAAELSDAYTRVKESVSKDLRMEHTTNITAAVQNSWETANRQLEAAVAAARAEAAEEARQCAETRFAAERAELRAEHRKALQQKEDAYIETSRAEKAELKALRDEVGALRAAARDAERKAALQQSKAVMEAVRVAEDIAARKALIERKGGTNVRLGANGVSSRRNSGQPHVTVQLAISSATTWTEANTSRCVPRNDLASEWED
ncbi:MAG: hypothetical protein SGPRY_005903 [Prymnesium sp.]